MTDKTLILTVFLLFAAYTLAQNPPRPIFRDTCSDCKANISKLAGFLIQDQVLDATVQSFKNDLCTNNAYTNDEKGCQSNATYWKDMAKAFFPKQDVQMIACQEMGKCNKTLSW